MTGHFDQHLKLRDLILQKRPKVIVECGAGAGDCTKLLAHLRWCFPFDLHVISDKAIVGVEGAIFHLGISYLALKEFRDESIGLCMIDTDHNYWTLTQELEALLPKMELGGLVVMHDVDEFYYNTGMGHSYWNDVPYPKEEIEACAKQGGCGLALIDFLSRNRGAFKLLWWNPNHFGAAVIQKVNVTDTLMIKPGTNPVFAKPS